MARLPALKLDSKGQPLVITGSNTITLQDVLTGDIWLCSGQSNMEWTLSGCAAQDDIAAANFPAIRRIKFPHVAMSQPVPVTPGKWETCTPQTAANFTAVGFYFARRVQQETGLAVERTAGDRRDEMTEQRTRHLGHEQHRRLARCNLA